MTLVEIIEYIQDFATAEHVNSSFVGDIYELNHKQDIEYPAFVITQGTHTTNTDEGVDTYNLNLFLVDRLTEDKSNELMVQSWAQNGLRNILQMIEETTIGYSSTAASTSPFTERFDSLCAGAIMKLAVNVDINNCWKPRFVTSINGMQGDVYIPGIDPDAFYTKDEIDAKFNPRTNFKTINNETIIGTGNIEIKAGADISDETVKGIDTSTEIYLTTDDEGKLMIGKFSPIKIGTVSGGGTYELGSTVSSVTLKWSYTGSNPVNQTVDGSDIAANLREITLSDGWSSNKTFTIKGTDTKGNSSSGSTSLTFNIYTYYGVLDTTSPTNAQLIGLSKIWNTKTFTAKTFDCTGGKYPYIAIPKATVGTTDPQFWIGGLRFSDYIREEVTITNASNHKDVYYVYRTNSIQTGKLSIELK